MTKEQKDDPKRLVTIAEILIFTLCIVVLIFLTYTFFVGFKKGIPSDRITGGLEKRDWLYFWGSIIGVIGTTLFAWISWKQNRTLAYINTEQERERREFSELELAATFYSSIFIERVTITENLIQIFMQSTGKIPPSIISINSLHLYCGRRKTSELIDALTIHEEFGKQYKVICQQSHASSISYLIQIRGNHFIANTSMNESEQEGLCANQDPDLRLVLDLSIFNPLKIKTVIAGEVLFSLNYKVSRSNKGNPFVYDVFDSFLEVKEYSYFDTSKETE